MAPGLCRTLEKLSGIGRVELTFGSQVRRQPNGGEDGLWKLRFMMECQRHVVRYLMSSGTISLGGEKTTLLPTPNSPHLGPPEGNWNI